MSKAFRTEREYVELGHRDVQEINFKVGYKKARYGFIYGTVRCESTGKCLSNVLVKAINRENNKSYFAITNNEGFYALCIPPGDYLVFACLSQH